jgi:hypothetical protein
MARARLTQIMILASEGQGIAGADPVKIDRGINRPLRVFVNRAATNPT